MIEHVGSIVMNFSVRTEHDAGIIFIAPFQALQSLWYVGQTTGIGHRSYNGHKRNSEHDLFEHSSGPFGALRRRRRKSRGHKLDHVGDGEGVGDISPSGQPAAGVLRNLRVVAIDVAMAAISTLPTART